MGHISFFDLEKLKREHNAEVFIETGTYLGDSLAHAAKYNFKKLISIEITPELVIKARERFKNDLRIEIVEGSSSDVLGGIIKNIDGNIILWLDAHFPGYFVDLNGEKDKDKRIPLEKEVSVLAQRVGQYEDVILIDDLRCYEDNLPNIKSFDEHVKDCGLSLDTRKNIIGTDSQFIYDAFSTSHDIEKIFVHEGYLSVLPKKKNLNLKKIVFFNHGHLGDTLIAKIFIKEIIKQLPATRTALSNNYSYDYIKDIVDEHIPISSLFDRFESNGKCKEAFIENDILYINTWFAPPCIQPSDNIGYNNYREPLKINNIVYNFDLHLKCFETLLDNFNKKYNVNIDISYIAKNKKNYILDLYEESVDLSSIPFISSSNKKILIFNQIATSGQSDNGNYEPGILNILSNENIVIYTSLQTSINHSRLINLKNYFSDPDLFKTAKLSTLCDYICGPSNATIISTWVKPNLLRPNLEYIVVNRNDIGEATLLSDLDCKTTVVNSVSDLFLKLGEKLNGQSLQYSRVNR